MSRRLSEASKLSLKRVNCKDELNGKLSSKGRSVLELEKTPV
jgi:hypothetical protein